MRENVKRVTIVFSFLMLGFVLSAGKVSAKTVTQNLKMLQGSTRCVEHNCSDVKKITIKKKRRLSDWESRLLNIVVLMMRRRIIYSLMSQWPPNVEEPTRSILF